MIPTLTNVRRQGVFLLLLVRGDLWKERWREIGGGLSGGVWWVFWERFSVGLGSSFVRSLFAPTDELTTVS